MSLKGLVKGFYKKGWQGSVPAFAGWPVLLVAFPAVDRPALGWLERNSGLSSAIGASRWVHLARLVAPISASSLVHYDYLLVGSTDPIRVYFLQFITRYKITRTDRYQPVHPSRCWPGTGSVRCLN